MKYVFVFLSFFIASNVQAASCLFPSYNCPNLGVGCTTVEGWREGLYGDPFMGWAGYCEGSTCASLMAQYCDDWYGGTYYPSSDTCDNTGVQDIRIESCFY